MTYVKYYHNLNQLYTFSSQGSITDDEDFPEAEIIEELAGEDTINLETPYTETELKTIRKAEKDARKLMDIASGINRKGNKDSDH